MTEYEPVIGLETHIQLNTASKIFCSCKADSWNDAPNTNICPICSGLPGVLPVLNEKVVEKAVLLAQAMHSISNPYLSLTVRIISTRICPKAIRSHNMTSRSAKGGYHGCSYA